MFQLSTTGVRTLYSSEGFLRAPKNPRVFFPKIASPSAIGFNIVDKHRDSRKHTQLQKSSMWTQMRAVSLFVGSDWRTVIQFRRKPRNATQIRQTPPGGKKAGKQSTIDRSTAHLAIGDREFWFFGNFPIFHFASRDVVMYIVTTVVEKGGFKHDRMMVSILQTYTVCLPTVKKPFKDATATSTELIPSFYRT
jgi:hypothetical protein